MGLVVLVSGGIDSTLMMVMAAEEGIATFPLFIDYGQLGVEREWRACQAVHLKYNLPRPVRMDLSGYGKTIPSGITDPRMRINEDAFLPGRNLLFIVAGAGYACHVHANGVAIGLLSPKSQLFPDQGEDFIRQCESILEVAIGRHINVVAPLVDLDKREVLAMAKARGIEGTYSCHAGTDLPCGECVSCIEFIKASGRT